MSANDEKSKRTARAIDRVKHLFSSFIFHPSSSLSCLIVWLLVPSVALTETEPRARVVLVQDPASIQHFDPSADRVKRLVERGILELTGKSRPDTAWQQFVKSNDVVGIKIVARGGPLFSVRKEVVSAIVTGLKSAGVPDSHIVVWDKYQSDLVEAGYTINESSNAVHVVGVVPGIGFDPEASYRSPHAGKIIWGDLLFGSADEISGDSHLTRIISQQVTRLINVAVLDDHSEMGLSGSLLNLALGSVDNVRRFHNDSSACESAIADICSMPVVRAKTALHIIDGLLGQYAFGPNFHPGSTWHTGGIYLSIDPVALDTIALEEIETQRKRAGFPPIGERAHYIQTAAAAGLGIADREKIDLIKLSSKK